MRRSYDSEVFKRCVSFYPKEFKYDIETFDFEDWLSGNNIMYVEGDSVGLLSFEYPGFYTGHWFFQVRGREALNLATEMLNDLFKNYDAKVVRGITPIYNQKAIRAAKLLGFKSHGIVSYPDGDCELLTLTKEDLKHG